MQTEYIIGDEQILQKMSEVTAWHPFDERVLNFCGKLSKALTCVKNYAQYPDLVTLAFWLRRGNLQKIRAQYEDVTDNLGRGLIFHIAPGNVPLSFAYSLVTGLLTGNTNIIRLPSRKFEQADIFCAVLNELLREDSELAQRVCLIKYPHDKAVTDELSAKCQTRIIWGGDNTVNTIRQSPIPPRATEITFANRFSICLINADKYLSDYEPKKTAHDFYIDTYLTDQNACSSPRIIFWTGEKISEAKEIFWNALQNEIDSYEISPVTTVDKLLTFCKFAAENECKLVFGKDYRIVRVQIENLNNKVLENIIGGGYFYECDISEVNEILPACTLEMQTLSYIGFDGEKLRQMILSNAPQGVDRIVATGKTMDFGFVWDGKNIVRELTRIVSLS